VTLFALSSLARPGDSGLTSKGQLAARKPDAPMLVDLYFFQPPSLQKQATLVFKVTVLADAPNTEITIRLPETGFRRLAGEPRELTYLSKGETRTWQIEMLSLRTGNFHFSASAISHNGTYVFGKTAELFVQLDVTKSIVSKSNIFAEKFSTESEAEKISEKSAPPAVQIPDHKFSSEQSTSLLLAPGPGQIVVRGYWFYRDRNSIDQPLRDARVEIWDADTLSGDDLLSTVHTDNSGHFESDAITNSDEEGGGQDVYVKVYSTDDTSVRVSDFSNSLYFSQTTVAGNVPDGFVDVGTSSIADSNNRMAYYIYDKIANDAFDYLATTVGWMNTYNLQVRWSPTSNTGTFYTPGGSIDMVAGDRWDSDVFLHEYGHFVMYKIYGNIMPPDSSGSHSWGIPSTLGLGWSEGWADFLQAAIQNDRFYDDTEDLTLHIDFEPPVPAARYAEDEGGVAASMWDIFDSGGEPWDSVALGINGIWSIAANNRPNDFVGFYSSWINSSNGFNSPVTSIIQHHEIIPNPVLTASLVLTPGQPYTAGQTLTGSFSITNRGNRPITFESLTIGGRLNGDITVMNFPPETSLTLNANQSYQYSKSFTFQQAADYKFFPAYTLQGNVSRTGLLGEIPKDAGVIDLVSFTVNSSSQFPLQLYVENSGQAAALDNPAFLRDPFPVLSNSLLYGNATDRNTRLAIFLQNLAPSSSTVVNLMDSAGISYDVVPEVVVGVPNTSLTEVVLRIPNNLATGTCTITVRAQGQTTNFATISVRP